MKNLLVIGVMLIMPCLLSAQTQKARTEEDFQKQMEEIRKEMQSQISALRDSIAMLQDQLREHQTGNPDFELYYKNPWPSGSVKDWSELDSLLREEQSHAQNWNFSFPPFDFHHMMSPQDLEYQYHLKELEAPPCPPAPPEHKHNHEWMKMLPFYNLFNK